MHNALETTDDIRLFDIPEVLRRLGMSRRTFYQRVASGEIQTVRVGRRRYVRPADLAAFIDSLPPAA